MTTTLGSAPARMLEEARTDVQNADQKASLLLATVGVGFGVIVGGQISSGWRAADALSVGGQVLWWIGAAMALASVVTASSAVWPRYRLDDAPKYGITYWGHAASFTDPVELQAALVREHADHEALITDRVIHQLWRLSRIVLQKYRWIRVSLLLAGGAGIALSVAVVFLGV